MTTRPDVAARNVGPHLPSGVRPTSDNVADPARGALVPRCHTCGMPDRPASALLEFALYLGVQRAGRYRLCERCFERVNAPPTQADADPLGAA